MELVWMCTCKMHTFSTCQYTRQLATVYICIHAIALLWFWENVLVSCPSHSFCHAHNIHVHAVVFLWNYHKYCKTLVVMCWERVLHMCTKLCTVKAVQVVAYIKQLPYLLQPCGIVSCLPFTHLLMQPPL